VSLLSRVAEWLAYIPTWNWNGGIATNQRPTRWIVSPSLLVFFFALLRQRRPKVSRPAARDIGGAPRWQPSSHQHCSLIAGSQQVHNGVAWDAHLCLGRMLFATMSSSTTTVDYRVRIYDKLTPNDKQTILLSAGFESGAASTVAQHGPADFWAALAQQGKELDESIWKEYPACLLIIQERIEVLRATSASLLPRSSARDPHIPNETHKAKHKKKSKNSKKSKEVAMSPYFEIADMYELHLHQLLQNDFAEICHHLHKNAHVKQREFFVDGMLHDIGQVFAQAKNSMLTVELVAQAIASIGRLDVANDLRKHRGLATKQFGIQVAPESNAASTSPLVMARPVRVFILDGESVMPDDLLLESFGVDEHDIVREQLPFLSSEDGAIKIGVLGSKHPLSPLLCIIRVSLDEPRSVKVRLRTLLMSLQESTGNDIVPTMFVSVSRDSNCGGLLTLSRNSDAVDLKFRPNVNGIIVLDGVIIDDDVHECAEYVVNVSGSVSVVYVVNETKPGRLGTKFMRLQELWIKHTINNSDARYRFVFLVLHCDGGTLTSDDGLHWLSFGAKYCAVEEGGSTYHSLIVPAHVGALMTVLISCAPMWDEYLQWLLQQDGRECAILGLPRAIVDGSTIDAIRALVVDNVHKVESASVFAEMVGEEAWADESNWLDHNSSELYEPLSVAARVRDTSDAALDRARVIGAIVESMESVVVIDGVAAHAHNGSRSDWSGVFVELSLCDVGGWRASLHVPFSCLDAV
jgi:hypothetical protein